MACLLGEIHMGKDLPHSVLIQISVGSECGQDLLMPEVLAQGLELLRSLAESNCQSTGSVAIGVGREIR